MLNLHCVPNPAEPNVLDTLPLKYRASPHNRIQRLCCKNLRV